MATGSKALYPQTGGNKLGPLKVTPAQPIFVPEIRPGQSTPDHDQTRGSRFFKTKYNPNEPFNLERPTVDRSGQVRENDSVDFSTRLTGDVDPFTGQAQGGGTFPDNDEQGILVKGITEQLGGIAELLAQNLAATRAMMPNTLVSIDGPASLAAGQPQPYYFTMDGRKIPALRLYIFNNSGQIVSIGLSNSASANDIPIAANGGILNLTNAVVDFITLYSPAAINVNGQLARISAPRSANALIIVAWSNPEYRRVFGQI